MDDEGLDRDLDDVAGVYLRAGGEFLVGEAGGEVVAMGVLQRFSREEAEIKRMRVRPDHWRRGFGQNILDALEGRALGYRTLRLHTTAGQTAARRLYEKNGFYETGRGRPLGFDVVLYGKILSQPRRRSTYTRSELQPDE